MANLQKGLKRIIWILSIGVTVITWTFLFSKADLTPEKKINTEGVSFINWLDAHYFEAFPQNRIDRARIILDARLILNRKTSKSRLMETIENAVKADSQKSWPYIWEYYKTDDIGVTFDSWNKHRELKDKMRQALQLNEEKIKKTFPDIDFEGFSYRYNLKTGDIDSTGTLLTKYREFKKEFDFKKYIIPESYFKISYQRPYGLMIGLFFLGFVPFIAVWIIWFLTNWVVRGFKS